MLPKIGKTHKEEEAEKEEEWERSDKWTEIKRRDKIKIKIIVCLPPTTANHSKSLYLSLSVCHCVVHVCVCASVYESVCVPNN